MSPAIYQWAARHGVSFQALAELQAIFGMQGTPIAVPAAHDLPAAVKGTSEAAVKGTSEAAVKGTSEAAVQAAVRLEAARKGVRLFRNNVGALVDSRGVPVRYGLANDSKQLNEVMKSADLIGWRPLLIEPRHVGTVVAQFVSREVKAVGWHYTGAGREPAQLAWAQLVTAGGGDAAFCTGEGTL